ncbi:thioesterase II family protein [Pseudoalteromonas rhizosphaerae]|uniref:Thioesterase II family protein n=1 Tax=Pseudoalteromonas rhizosphaerae TaxID=2518973 RepID=A0ABW8KV84_9GAMM
MNYLSKSPWLYIPKPNVNAHVKLICFPYAGGSTRSFSNWVKILPDYVELIMIAMPGRGSRFSEASADCMDTLTDTLLNELSPHLSRETIFFGHSLGARVAFEVYRKLKKSGVQGPCHFIASGSANPGKDRSAENTHSLSDTDFIKKLRNLNGTPPEVLENEELMTLFIPVLRADFKLADTYCYNGSEQLPCNVTVFMGLDDEISEQEQLAWQHFFSGQLTFKKFNGDHFFIDSHNEIVGNAVCDLIQEIFIDKTLTHVG